jgi:hypothetical protein
MPSEVRKLSFLHVLESIVLVIASLYWARAVFVPLALALQMLQHVLDPRRFEVEVPKAALLAAEVLSLVGQSAPTLVCSGLVPPGGFAQTRYLCKRLRARFPTLPIVVGYWRGRQDEPETLARLRLDSLTQVGTTLTQTRQLIMQAPPAYASCGPHCTECGIGHTPGENHDAQRLVGTAQRDLEGLEHR